MALAALLAGCGASSSHQPRQTNSSPRHTTAAAESQIPTATTPHTTTSHISTAGASNVRLPATFTIGPGGKLTPPSVTAPAGVLIGLTLISGDGAAHRVMVGGRQIVVPPSGRTYSALRGLTRGRHPVLVDGSPRGTLVVGGQPGP